VAIGIETDRGPWVAALIAAGYTVYAINPRQVARYRERHGTSGAKSDAGDAHTLADMVRTDRHQLRPVAGDSDLAQAVKVVARAHQTLIWERHRQVLRLRTALREFFPAALEAYGDLTAPDVLELLGRAPDPARAARLSRSQIAGAMKRGPPAPGRRQGGRHPGRPAHRSAGPAAGRDRCLRRDGPVAGRHDRRLQRPDHCHGRAGEPVFWASPGR
jgi:hypothetical protein